MIAIDDVQETVQVFCDTEFEECFGQVNINRSIALAYPVPNRVTMDSIISTTQHDLRTGYSQGSGALASGRKWRALG